MSKGRIITINDFPQEGKYYKNQPNLDVNSLRCFNTENVSFKVIVIGDAFVGKTCLIHRMAEDVYDDHGYQATIGVEFNPLIAVVNGKEVKVALWDIAGSDTYRTITKNYFRASEIALLCFSLNNKTSFTNLEKWHQTLLDNTSSLSAKFLVGCKADDSNDEISPSEISDFAKKINAEYFSTSSKTSLNVIELVSRFVFIGSVLGHQKRTNAITLSAESTPAVPEQATTTTKKKCC